MCKKYWCKSLLATLLKYNRIMKIKTNCSICSIEIERSPSQLSGKNYCSQKCYISAKTFRGFKKTGVEKNCLYCDGKFYVPPVRSESAKFCSTKCKGLFTKIGFYKCEQCQKEFYSKGNKKAKFCSRECTAKSKRKWEEKDCPVCNNSFYGYSDEAKYCSVDCANVGMDKKVDVTCIVCSKKVKRSPSSKDSKYCSIKCRDKDPAVREKLMEMNRMQQLGNPTKPELVLYDILKDIGVAHEIQHLLANKFCVDSFIPDKNLVIQADGDYWHGNPKKFPVLDKRQSRKVALDKSQDAYLKKMGLSVLRLWESQLMKDREGCKLLILQALQ